MADPLAAPFGLDEYGIPIGTAVGELARRNQADLLRQGANSAIATAATNIAPDRALPGLLGYVPLAGTVEGMLGFGHMLGSGAAKVANAGLNRWGINVPEPPEFMKQAGEHFQDTKNKIAPYVESGSGGVLTTPDPTTAVGSAADLVGGSIGAGVGLGPAGLVNLAPRGLKTITSLVVPSLAHSPRSILASGVIGTGLGVAEDAKAGIENAQAAAAAVTSPPALNTTVAAASTPATPATPSFSQTAFAPPSAPAPAVPKADPDQVPAITAIPSPPPASFSDVAFAPPSAAGPTFTQQGNTAQSLGLTALEVVGTLGAIATGGHFYRRGARVTEAAREARFNDPAYAAKVQEYNADVISRGPNSGTLSPPGGEPTPAPLPEGNVVRRATVGTAHAAVNEAAKIQDAIHQTAADPSIAEHLSAAVGNKYDEQLQHNKTREFLRTGFDERTNTRVPAMERIVDDFAKLTEPQKIALADGLRAANELDNRKNNLRTLPKNVAPDITDVRHDFIGKSEVELHSLDLRMRNDPVLADIATRYKQVTDGVIKIGQHPGYGFFSPAEAKELLFKHPNYVPEMDVNGKPTHPFGIRDRSAATGQAQVTSHPIIDLAQHVEQLYPLFERNLTNREMMDHFTSAQQRYPQAAQFMQKVSSPTAGHTSYYPSGGLGEGGGSGVRENIVAVRTPTGVVHVRIDNPVVRDAMLSHSRASAQIRLDAVSKLRRMYTQGTTGLMSLATGRAIPLRNAVYTAMSAPVTAPKQMYGGIADRLVQRATGRTSSLARAVDMTANIPGTAASYARGVADRRVRNIGNIFDPKSGNPINRFLRTTLSDAQVDGMAQAAKRYYEATATAKLERMGIGGAGSPMSLAAPGVVTGSKAGPFGDPAARIRLESARLSPKAFFSGQWMGTKPFLMNMQHAAAEAASHISDAGHDFIGRLNLDNPNMHPETMTYELRNLVGNAARTGASPVANVGRLALPYANVSMQGMGRFARAIGERPAAAPLTMAMGLGSFALLSILTHMRSAAHLDFLQNQVSLQQREANVILGTSDDPLKPNVIPLPQELRAPYAFVLDAISKAVNIIAARHDQVSFKNLWEGLQDFFGSHITTSNALAMRHGMVDLLDFFNPPPVLGKVDWNYVAQNGISSIPSAYEPVVGKGSIGNNARGQLPEQQPETALDTKTGQLFKNVLANTFGAVAHVLDTGGAMMRYHNQGHSLWDSIGMAGRDWLQQSRESNMSLNHMLWETPIRLSVQTPIAETLQPSLNALKQLPAMPKPLNLGFTGTRLNRVPVPVTGEAPVAQDPQMIQMLMSAHAYDKRITAAMAPIVAMKAQMGAVSRMGMDPIARRDWLNNQTRIIADRYKLVDAYIGDLNATMSKFAGKPIRFTDVDWSKGMDQFR